MDAKVVSLLSKVKPAAPALIVTKRLSQKIIPNLIEANEDSDFFFLGQQNELRYVNLKEAATAESDEDLFNTPIEFEDKMALPTNSDLRRMSLGPSGSRLCLWGPANVFVVLLPPARRLAGNALNFHHGQKARLVSVCEDLLVLSPGVAVVSAQWHPLSPTTLCVLTNDGRFHLTETGAEAKFNEALEPVQSFVTGAPNPVDFCFGPNAGWQRFAVYTLDVSGALTCLCPVVPFGLQLPKTTVMELWNTLHDVDELKEGQSIKEARAWLSAVFGEADPDMEAEDDFGQDDLEAFARGLSMREMAGGWVSARRGLPGWHVRPQEVSLSNDSSICAEGVACSSLVCLTAADPFHGSSVTQATVLCRAYQAFFVDAILIVDQILPRWERETGAADEHPHVTGSVMEVANLGFQESTATLPSLMLDPKQPAVCYLCHSSGVAMLSFQWVEELETLFSGGQLPSKLVTDENCVQVSLLLRAPPNPTQPKAPGVVGVGVVSEALLGHLMIIWLAEGRARVLNLTAQRYLEKLGGVKTEAAQKEGSPTLGGSDIGVAPFPKTVSGQLKKIRAGLSSLPLASEEIRHQLLEEATQETVREVLECRNHLEQNVVDPLLELSQKTLGRLSLLKEIQGYQKEKVDELDKKIHRSLQDHQNKLTRASEIEQRSKNLADRASAVLCALLQLQPTVTKAEQEYFEEIERLSQRCTTWEGKLDQLKRSAKQLQEGVSGPTAQLAQDQKDSCFQMLLEEQNMIAKQVQDSKDMQLRLKKISIENIAR